MAFVIYSEFHGLLGRCLHEQFYRWPGPKDDIAIDDLSQHNILDERFIGTTGFDHVTHPNGYTYKSSTGAIKQQS
jgi:hypothetical protein